MNRKAEAPFVAADITRRVRTEGLRYGSIAVVTGDIAGYGEVLQAECKKAGVPVFLDSKRKMFHNPCIALIRAVLQNALSGFSYESVFRYLKSGLTAYTPEEISVLENYCLACGIRGERMWKQPWKYQYRTKKKTDLEALNSLRERVYADLGEISKGLNAAETAGERTELLYRFMEKLDIEEKLSAMSDRFEAEGDAVRAAEYRQVYKSIIELFDHFMELLREEKMSLREYAELMETGLRECKVGVVPPGADCVVIGDITRTRLSEIDVLFLAGVNEGVTPAPAGEGGLLSETEREFLKEKGVELTPTKKEGIYTEQFYLYAMLTKPKRRLVLTYSRLSADGKQLQPSYFLRRIGELFTDFKERETEERSYLSLLQNDGGRAYLLDGIRRFAEEGNTGDTAFFELYRQAVLTDAEMTRRLLKTAFFGNPSVGLSAEAAKRLYGAILYGSVTRLEHYASCAFAHFLQYGLSLEERAEYRVAAPELGILYHTALELFTGKVKDSGLSWHTLTKEAREEICTASVLEAAEGFENGVFSGTKRNEYLVTKAKRVLLKTVEMLQEQIKGSLFEPEHCELAFTHTAKYMALHGKIDRYDLCRNEEKWYLRVIDYKSGAKKFDLTELYYGLQVQLEVYLAAALRQAKTEYGEEPLPAGMFYFHVEDPFLPREKYSETALKQAFRPEGLFNEAPSAVTALDTSLKAENGGLMPSAASALIHAETDKEGMLKAGAGHVSGEHFSRLTDFVYRKLEEEAAAILAGDTEIKPYRYKKKTPCEWCNYRSVCGFDNRMFEFGYRDLPEIAKEELWEKFGKENHGDNVHEGPEGGH
jgi:ATP-dependent helicase/nuclease subunit B